VSWLNELFLPKKFEITGNNIIGIHGFTYKSLTGPTRFSLLHSGNRYRLPRNISFDQKHLEFLIIFSVFPEFLGHLLDTEIA